MIYAQLPDGRKYDVKNEYGVLFFNVKGSWFSLKWFLARFR